MLPKPRFSLVVAVVAVALFGTHAFAWGPATHVEIGSTVLSNLALLPAALAGLLAKNRKTYLYGNIAADVVFAKRWSRVKQCCHHWSTAFAILDDAREGADRAFALGYLSHLAADTVAHGKFVPRQVQSCGCSVNFGHFYWELRGDALQSDATWDDVNGLVSGTYDRQHALMENHITDTLLSYEMNRLLFERMNAFAVRKGFRRGIGVWSRFSRYELPHTLMTGYLCECVDRIQSVLTEGTRSPVLKEDPNGTSAMMQLRAARRQTRRLRRIGACTESRCRETTKALLPEMREDHRYKWRQEVEDRPSP